MKARITIEFEVDDPSEYLDEYSDVPKTDKGIADDLGKLATMLLREARGSRDYLSNVRFVESSPA